MCLGLESCEICPKGYFCTLGNATACPKGCFCPIGTGMNLKYCPSGTYSDVEGLSEVRSIALFNIFASLANTTVGQRCVLR